VILISSCHPLRVRSLAAASGLLVSMCFGQEAPELSAEEVAAKRDGVVRVQAFLDRQLFGPGKVDGAAGEFTFKAVINYHYSIGYEPLDDWAHVERMAARELPVIYAAFKIHEELLAFVNPGLSTKPAEQVGAKYLAYRSLLELAAERYHTDETFLERINPGRNLYALKVGDVLTVPNVEPFRIEEVAKYKKFDADEVLARNTVVVDTTERIAAIYNDQERLLAAFPITPGKPEFIPVGDWKLVNMVTTPEFRYDKKFLEEGTRGTEAYQLPPGPNSPVGIIWCGISKSGIGLHGTSSPRTIGRSQSAGCVRLANWDAIRLPNLVRPGARVIVR
jgi:lipoprotein-anchoring transpeptidase ErfK/SrfK